MPKGKYLHKHHPPTEFQKGHKINLGKKNALKEGGLTKNRKEYDKEYRRKHYQYKERKKRSPEEIREKKRNHDREWNKNHRAYRNYLDMIRRMRLRNIEGSFTLEQWEDLKKKFNYTCPMCNKQEPEIILSIDHIIPISRGGDNYIMNIQPLCRSCNSSKGNKI